MLELGILECRRVATAAAVVALVAVSACSHEAASSPPPAAKEAPRRQSLLLITLDTTRADALGCYGGPDWATPTLDALAQRGVRFVQARAPAPVTLPAHASILTGTWPFQHGVRDNGTFILGAGAVTLAERLKAAGYATAAVPGAWVVDSSFGLAQGFDVYIDLPQRADEPVAGEPERSAQEVVALATQWLDGLAPGAPFFLWAHFFDPHFPYAPPADLVAAHPSSVDPAKPSAKRQQKNLLYQLEVAAVDRALARLVTALDRFGGPEQVLIAVVGDHGEGLGEHGEATHSFLLHDSTLLVPFLLAHASLPKATVTEPVSTVDVAPTLLALLGLAEGDPAEQGFAGADLAPLWQGKRLATERPLYSETCATWFTYGWAPLWSIVSGRFKAIVGRDVKLFDLEADADEKVDVAAAHEEVVEAAKAQLFQFAELTAAAGRHAPDAAEMEKLHSLGYLTTTISSTRDARVLPGWQPRSALSPEEGLKNQRRYSQANILWQQGQKEEALAQLLALTVEEPENGHYAGQAAALLMTVGRVAEALPLARKSDELGTTTTTRSTLIAGLVAAGQKEEALRAAIEGAALFPKYLPLRLTAAHLLIDAGRGSDALPHLDAVRAAAASDPGLDPALTGQEERLRVRVQVR